MDDEIRLRVLFYRTSAGKEPVREWLKALPVEDRKIITGSSRNHRKHRLLIYSLPDGD